MTTAQSILTVHTHNNNALTAAMKNVVGPPPSAAAPKRAFTCLADLTGAAALPKEVTNVPNELLEKYPHTKRVGNYLLGKTLGEGSFAKVREGLHTVTGEKVAIKVIDKRRAKEDSYVHRNLRREGRILQLVRHPCIIHLYDILETENSYYLVMELCTGGDMMEYLKLRKSLPEKEARKYIRQIISAVDHLHRAGILHRDLKVENVLLDEKKNIKLIDFGLSRHFKLDENNVLGDFQQATQCGSPAYAAPELLGKNKYGPKVDIWSIGVNMYAMLTGSLPFTAEPFSIKVLYQKMMNFDINPIPEHISPGCVDLLKKVLNPDPNQRISMEKLMQNDWINEGYKQKLSPAPFPNKMKAESLNKAVLEFMEEKFQMTSSQTVKVLLQNQSCSMFAVYHLLTKRMLSYMAKVGSVPTNNNNNNNLANLDQNNNDKKQVVSNGGAGANGGIRRIEPPSFAPVNGTNSSTNASHQQNNSDESSEKQTTPSVAGSETRNASANVSGDTKVVQFNKLTLGLGNRAHTSPEKCPNLPQSTVKYPGMHTDRRAMERQTRQGNYVIGAAEGRRGSSSGDSPVSEHRDRADRCKTSTYNKPNIPGSLLERNRPVTGRGRLDKGVTGGSMRRPVSLNRTAMGNNLNRSSNDEFNGDVRGRSANNNNNNNNNTTTVTSTFDQTTFKPVGILKRVTQPRLFRATSKDFTHASADSDNNSASGLKHSNTGVAGRTPYDTSTPASGVGMKRSNTAGAVNAVGINRANTAAPGSTLYKWSANGASNTTTSNGTTGGVFRKNSVSTPPSGNTNENSSTLPSITSPRGAPPRQLTNGLTVNSASERPKTSSV